MLGQRLTDVQTLPTRWRAMAARYEDNVQTMLKQMSRAVEIEVAPIRTVRPTEPQETKRSSSPHPLPSQHQPFGQRPAIALSEEESSGIADMRQLVLAPGPSLQHKQKTDPSRKTCRKPLARFGFRSFAILIDHHSQNFRGRRCRTRSALLKGSRILRYEQAPLQPHKFRNVPCSGIADGCTGNCETAGSACAQPE